MTLLFASLFLFGYAQQKLQLIDGEGNPYSHGDEIRSSITVNDLENVGGNLEYHVEILVYNQANYELEVSTLRTNMPLISGMQAYVCFGVCDETFELLKMDYTIEERGSLSYSLHLIPNGYFGTNKFKVDFTAEDETLTLYIEIDMQPLGVKEQNSEKISLSAYPNPVQAGSNFKVSYTIPDKNNSCKLVFRNILGSEVMSIPLLPHEKSISVDSSPLVQGVYFLSIENKNQVSIVKKLIVK